MTKVLTWFIRLWVGAVVLLNVAGIAGMILGASSVIEAWSRITDTYSPFNLWTHGLNLVFVLPAIGAWYWRRKITETGKPRAA